MTPLYRNLTLTLLELDLLYAEGVQKHLLNSEYHDIGESLTQPLQDYKEAIEDYEKNESMKKESKELILKSLEQDREYTKMLMEKMQEIKEPFIMMPASFFAGLISDDIQKGIEEIKNLPERD